LDKRSRIGGLIQYEVGFKIGRRGKYLLRFDGESGFLPGRVFASGSLRRMRMFNTLNYAKKLEGTGLSRDQAEAHVQIIAEIVEVQLATKDELKNAVKELRDEMQKMEYRLTIKLGVMLTASTSILFALLKSHA
jgi:hypothetical protein